MADDNRLRCRGGAIAAVYDIIGPSGHAALHPLRDPGEDRDPFCSASMPARWIPAFAGMTKKVVCGR
jgi:hypothetical protein